MKKIVINDAGQPYSVRIPKEAIHSLSKLLDGMRSLRSRDQQNIILYNLAHVWAFAFVDGHCRDRRPVCLEEDNRTPEQIQKDIAEYKLQKRMRQSRLSQGNTPPKRIQIMVELPDTPSGQSRDAIVDVPYDQWDILETYAAMGKRISMKELEDTFARGFGAGNSRYDFRVPEVVIGERK